LQSISELGSKRICTKGPAFIRITDVLVLSDLQSHLLIQG